MYVRSTIDFEERSAIDLMDKFFVCVVGGG